MDKKKRTRTLAAVMGSVLMGALLCLVTLAAFGGGNEDVCKIPSSSASSQVSTAGQGFERSQGEATQDDGVSQGGGSSQGIARDGDSAYVDGTVLVSLEQGSSVDDLWISLENEGIRPAGIEMVAEADSCGAVVLVSFDGEESPVEVSDRIAQSAVVASAEPDYVLELSEWADDSAVNLDETVNDTFAPDQWALTSLDAYGAWDIAHADGSVTVAVIDSGVDGEHVDLRENLLLDYARDTSTDKSGAAAVHDYVGHGTHVAGIIAAVANNGMGVAGVSYNAKVLPIKATTTDKGTLSVSNVVKAIDYVIQLKTNPSSPEELRNIRVINMSLGGYTYSAAYEQACQRAVSAGILVAAAAGNDSKSTVQYPASFSCVVGVSALMEQAGTPGVFASSYSNHGPEIALSAPGTNVVSTVPDGMYSSKSGTSMSTPVVSAAAALVYSMQMDAEPAAIEARLEETATDLGEPGRDEYYGYGAVNLKKAVVASTTSIAYGEMASIPEQKYTGSPVEPKVKITYFGKTLTRGVDYEVTYSDNVEIGRATIVATGIGRYSGQLEGHFIISEDPPPLPVEKQRVFRLYNKVTSEHLWTTDENEYQELAQGDWLQEGVAWMSPTELGMPVYRLYNEGLGVQGKMAHHYSADKEECDALVASFGWAYDNEGAPLWLSAESVDGDKHSAFEGALPAYRLYSSGLSSHHITLSETERRICIDAWGWEDEAIGFYAYDLLDG